MKQVTLNQIGYEIRGTSTLKLWGGGEGEIKMDTSHIVKLPLTKEKLLRCVNDGQFGCESIEEANIHIFDLYENGYVEHNRDVIVKGTITRNKKYFCRGI